MPFFFGSQQARAGASPMGSWASSSTRSGTLADFNFGLNEANPKLATSRVNTCDRESRNWGLPPSGMPYLEGQGDLVNSLTVGLTRVTTWFIGVY